jgi:hypothetical protein
MTKHIIASILAGFIACGVSAQTVLNDHNLQPEAWSPVQPFEPGVNANGDLGFPLPLITVPGRGGFDFDVSLQYRSGVTVDQPSTWVGVGWSFDPGGITRDVQALVTGMESGTSYDVDFTELHPHQRDQYAVSFPGGGFTMSRFNLSDQNKPGNTAIGQRGGSSSATPVPVVNSSTHAMLTLGGCTGDGAFFPHEWAPYAICPSTGNGTVSAGGKTTSKSDYRSFTITASDGTRYVFADPVLASYEHFVPNTAYRETKTYVSRWRLRSILSSDFTGNELEPQLDSGTGNWIRLYYSAVESRGTGPAMRQGSVLTVIETPTHIATFDAGDYSGQYGQFSYQLAGVKLCSKELGAIASSAHCPSTSVSKSVALTQQRLDPGFARLFLTNVHVYGAKGESLPGYAFGYEDGFRYGHQAADEGIRMI